MYKLTVALCSALSADCFPCLFCLFVRLFACVFFLFFFLYISFGNCFQFRTSPPQFTEWHGYSTKPGNMLRKVTPNVLDINGRSHYSVWIQASAHAPRLPFADQDNSCQSFLPASASARPGRFRYGYWKICELWKTSRDWLDLPKNEGESSSWRWRTDDGDWWILKAGACGLV